MPGCLAAHRKSRTRGQTGILQASCLLSGAWLPVRPQRYLCCGLTMAMRDSHSCSRICDFYCLQLLMINRQYFSLLAAGHCFQVSGPLPDRLSFFRGLTFPGCLKRQCQVLRGSVAYSQSSLSPSALYPFYPSSFEQEPEALGSVDYIYQLCQSL